MRAKRLWPTGRKSFSHAAAIISCCRGSCGEEEEEEGGAGRANASSVIIIKSLCMKYNHTAMQIDVYLFPTTVIPKIIDCFFKGIINTRIMAEYILTLMIIKQSFPRTTDVFSLAFQTCCP